MSKDKTQQHKRSIYYIEKEFQAKFIVKFCLLLMTGSLMTIAIVYWLAQHSTTVAIIHGRVDVHTTAEYLLPLMFQTVSIQLVVVSVATIGMTLLVSHKIAGPLFRLKAMFAGLTNGDLKARMHLREDDQLKKVADGYNTAITTLEVKVKALKQASTIEEVKRILEDFKTS